MSDSLDEEGKDRLQRLIGEDYLLQWIIGQGGMSTVWLADDTRHNREVAIKVLRSEYSDNKEFLNRFRNEAEAARSIDSPNVTATYDYREVREHPSGRTFCFIVMEYVRGESLADLLEREGALPENLALDVLSQAAQGLRAIHRLGMVHRDIKPGNLLISMDGILKITDFGIAKAAAAVPLTRTGMVVGTAQYVSPEQAQGHTVDSATDIYSLGVVGYEMLSGHRPFEGDTSVSVVIAHIKEQPPALSTSISAPTRELLGICLHKDPTTRYHDGGELADAIADVLEGHRPAPPIGPGYEDDYDRDYRRSDPRDPDDYTDPSSAAPQTVLAPSAPLSRSVHSSGDYSEDDYEDRDDDYEEDDLDDEDYEDDYEEEEPRRRSNAGLWIGFLLALILLIIAAAAVYFAGETTSPTEESTSETSPQRQTVTVQPAPEPPSARASVPASVTSSPSESRRVEPSEAGSPRDSVVNESFDLISNIELPEPESEQDNAQPEPEVEEAPAAEPPAAAAEPPAPANEPANNEPAPAAPAQQPAPAVPAPAPEPAPAPAAPAAPAQVPAQQPAPAAPAPAPEPAFNPLNPLSWLLGR